MELDKPRALEVTHAQSGWGFRNRIHMWKNPAAIVLFAAAVVVLGAACAPESSRFNPDSLPTQPEFLQQSPITPTTVIRRAERGNDLVRIGPGEIATYAYGAIVNETEDAVVLVYTDILNKLAKDGRVGINAPDRLMFITSLTDTKSKSTNQNEARRRYIEEQKTDGEFDVVITALSLTDFVRTDMGRRRPITASDIVDWPIIDSVLTKIWANELYKVTNNTLSIAGMMMDLPNQITAQAYEGLAIVEVGSSFLTQVNADT